jgi:TolB protein
MTARYRIAILVLAATAAIAARPITLPYQLTYSRNMDPAPTPDGRQLVYVSVFEGREQFFAMNADGSGSRRITSDAADHEDPAFSPDGRSIAFTRIGDDGERIYVMNADGTNARPITPAGRRAIHPSWSPDGRRLLYCTDDDLRPPAKNDSEIYSIDLADGRATILVSGGVNTYPALSPDGRRLAFRKIVDGNSEVFVADADGANPRNLTRNPAFEGWPAWSPDGGRIAFAGNRNSSYQIFVMNADGSDVRLVANTEGRATAPRWFPDGKRLYFTLCVNKDRSVGCEIMVAPLDRPLD